MSKNYFSLKDKKENRIQKLKHSRETFYFRYMLFSSISSLIFIVVSFLISSFTFLVGSNVALWALTFLVLEFTNRYYEVKIKKVEGELDIDVIKDKIIDDLWKKPAMTTDFISEQIDELGANKNLNLLGLEKITVIAKNLNFRYKPGARKNFRVEMKKFIDEYCVKIKVNNDIDTQNNSNLNKRALAYLYHK